MKTHLKALAIALLAISAPAMAEGDDATIYTGWDMYNSIWVYGDVFAYGDIRVASESGALVDQDQTTFANGSAGDGDNDAFASDNALRGASGNIGANIAAGVGNAQANDVALSSVDGNRVFAYGEIRVASESGALVDQDQTTYANGSAGDGDNDASASGNALRGASGNIGVNIAAGVGNAQHNGLSIAVASCGTCD